MTLMAASDCFWPFSASRREAENDPVTHGSLALVASPARLIDRFTH